MDDDALAPFVDALASSLIVMVLVCIFFLIQTATAITSTAKLETVIDLKKIEHYSPITYRKIFSANLDGNEFQYVVNFELEEDFVKQIKAKIADAKVIKITIESRDAEKKSAVNILRFLQYLHLPKKIKIKTEILKSDSVLSKVRWEIN